MEGTSSYSRGTLGQVVSAAAEPGRTAALLRLALFSALLTALFVTAAVSGALPSADRIRDWVDGFGPAGPFVFIPLSAALGCVLVPGPALAGAAGLLFGTALGTPVALAAAVLTAVCELTIARHLAGRQASVLLPERARRIDELLERRGFFAVLYLRLVPGVPFHLTNYAAGLTRLRGRDLAAGTAIGSAPRAFAYVALGGNLGDLGSPETRVAIAVLVAFGIAGVVVARRQLAAERGRAEPAAE